MANENFQVGWSTLVVDSLLSPCGVGEREEERNPREDPKDTKS